VGFVKEFVRDEKLSNFGEMTQKMKKLWIFVKGCLEHEDFDGG